MRVLFITGKGGVGKSAISSATALKLAELGYETLLMSTDPAHTLSDLFETRIGAEETKISKNLDAVQVDVVHEVTKHYSEIMDFITKVLKARKIDEILAYEIANFPGITGAAALLKLLRYLEDKTHDVYILDMVPSGDALRILYLPFIFSKFSRRFMKLFAPFVEIGKPIPAIANIPLPSKELIETEVQLLEMLEKIHSYMVDPKITSLRIIMNPDSFSIENAKRTLIQACIYGLNTDLVIVNKILPEELAESYLSEWYKIQRDYLYRCELEFNPIPIKKVKLLNKEVKGLESIKTLANEIFGDDDPAKVYYEGKPMQIVQGDEGLKIILKVPHVKRDELEIERYGDELLIHLNTFIGKSVVILPLPAVAYKFSLKKAKIIKDELHIYFGEAHE
ncbi:MAG: TRC40/GET3/ArsA family transport-energizing ATPase [Archaeoglobaceae archaeon]|nr:TRC40/GET3/ArsA family transport-energizing ATPase [Archaeoglobaceae archaeon]MDW8013335.1 TRC40/GET3/ArsA family transport-energizing ATPase [Archaeoglobaceae archaeon]